MAKTSARVTINREKADQILLRISDGLGAAAAEIAERAQSRAPDRAPYGEGLVSSFGWAVWVGTKKVAGPGDKPRRGVRFSKGGVTAIAGSGDPIAHLHELGTQHMGATPMLAPAAYETVSDGTVERHLQANWPRE